MPILAAHDSILESLTKIENATLDEKSRAFEMFGADEKESILEIEEDGTAYIEIVGPLSKNGPGLLEKLFGIGGASYKEIIQSIKIADHDSEVKKIVLMMDTPGGEVSGVDQVFQAIQSCKKEVIAENHGMIASAGYYIAAACDKIVAIDPACETGSIGVIITAVDYSEQDKAEGRKIVSIVSRNAENKAADISTEKGINIIQKRVDAIERIFYARISEGRDVSIRAIKENYGKGGLYIAMDPDESEPSALNVGMIDSVSTSENGLFTNQNNPAKAEIKTEVVNMTLQELLASNPAAKIEFDSALANAQAAGFDSGKNETEARVSKATAFMGKDSTYPKAIQDLCLKVISGESSTETLEAVITMHDSNEEARKALAAKLETVELKETSGQQLPSASIGGNVESVVDYAAAVEKKRLEKGA